MTKIITLAVVLSALALAGGVATTHAALATGISTAALYQTIGHGIESGECGDSERHNDGDRDGC